VPTTLQLCSLGIPCLYYGTEQPLPSGPEAGERTWLPTFGRDDALLREAMFGPEHPRAAGFAGTQGQIDAALPGFGAFGTAGAHVFDLAHPAFVRIKALIATRKLLRRVVADPQRPVDALGGGRILTVEPLGTAGRVFVDVGVLGPAEVVVCA
jgi:hypothetical protein